MPVTTAGDGDHAWLIVGQAGKPHGVHGDVLVDITTDFPERMMDGVRFGVGDDPGPTEFHHVHRVRYHKGKWLLSVKDIRQRETIEGWRGLFLYLPEQALEDLPEGYYYEHHLVDLACRSPEGKDLGTVIGLDPGEGQSRLIIRQGHREHLVPWVPEIVREVDLEGGTIIIDAPRGLFDDDALEAR